MLSYKIRERKVYNKYFKSMRFVYEYQTKGLFGLFKIWKPVSVGMFDTDSYFAELQASFCADEKPTLEQVQETVNSFFTPTELDQNK